VILTVIKGSVTVGGLNYPAQIQVELPDPVQAEPPNHLRVVPKAS
jgi:hypothetical protein